MLLPTLPTDSKDFNPLSPHGERHGGDVMADRIENFNPLSPHGERRKHRRELIFMPKFQSTLPAWGETFLLYNIPNKYNISIHSPRMGRDDVRAHHISDCSNFNPLSPHGERQH